MELVRRARALALGQHSLAICTQRILFIWSIKDASHIAWLDGKLQEAVSLAPPGLLKIKIYVTRMKEIPKARMSRQILPEQMYNHMQQGSKSERSTSPSATQDIYSPRRSPSKTSMAYTPSESSYPPTQQKRPEWDRKESSSSTSKSRPHPAVRALVVFAISADCENSALPLTLTHLPPLSHRSRSVLVDQT